MIESTILIRGVPFCLADTAGFRNTTGQIEKMGILKTVRKMEASDLVMVVIDQSRPLHKEDLRLIREAGQTKALVVFNKIDLETACGPGDVKQAGFELPAVRVSALTGEGMEDLENALLARVLSDHGEQTASRLIPNARQKAALENALACFTGAGDSARSGRPMEIIALDLQEGLTAVGDIIGEISHDDLLDTLFSRFCIGK
jgi:tRNA modification GTPase